ncbi:MAG: hypothetical protein Q8N18_24005 [Opitutaceae bacterium]|nr:hypothetical protein [Opitutaceae bacterium]
MKPAARTLLLPLALAAASVAADGSNSLPKVSPFSPVGTPATAAAAASETIEFAAVSTIGKRTDLVFKNKTTNKTSWIAKGETKDGISLVNYDKDREQAVVKFNGAEKVLSLRKAASASAGPRPVAPIPTGFNVPATQPAVAPVSVATIEHSAGPTTPAIPQTDVQKQETEARMLVSDLLEIGMAQRRAYEEAQRKTAEGGAATTPADSTPRQP